VRIVDIKLQPWSEDDLPLLYRLLGDPEMMLHLGGPESAEKISNRHQRYLQLPEADHMFKIVSGSASEALVSIGYWEKDWRDQLVYEMGWSVLPEYQSQGVATRAGELALEHARLENRHRFMHAFPSVSNTASNAICRKLGFSLLGAYEFEYPPGNFMTCSDWQFDLFSKRPDRDSS